ncbi:hypothetical protein HMPREF0005_01027 [Achromobacter xylosoxidans C54]|nr:hypothetical protein HMPREF0005_01027 [Achromobacter xylosoxidans C54]
MPGALAWQAGRGNGPEKMAMSGEMDKIPVSRGPRHLADVAARSENDPGGDPARGMRCEDKD